MTEACEREARSLALEKAYVHQVYQQISDVTDTLPDKGRAWPKVKQFLSDLEPGSLVCDVGCGNGKYLDVNPTLFEIGVDRCKRLTEVAREKDHEVLICDNLALPFRDESFDAVLSIAVVHHFATTDRRVQALRELARVLKIGGKLIISVWAMEQRHRKFESQDVLVPWHRPQQLSTPSLEFTSTTTTTTTSEDDGPPPYHAYTQTSDSESTRSQRGHSSVRKRGRNWHRGRSIDPSRPLSSSQSSSSLSSPNETCYSFVRRALQKLAGGKRGSSGRHRPWFLDTWTACTKEPPPRNYDLDGCEDIDLEDIQDLPIELRRLEEDTDLPQRRQTFACSGKLSSSIEISLGYKSKSLSDILTVNEKCMVRSRSSTSNLGSSNVIESSETAEAEISTTPATTTDTITTTTTKIVTTSVVTSQPKPKLIKQKQSLCEEEMEEEGGDLPTDMKDLVKRLPDFKVSITGGSRKQGNVFKQSSMNEELMSTERLREKEMLRQNIQKQASLNEEFLFRRQRTFDSIRDTFFSTSTAKRFQILKDGLTNKIKNSTTGIEKVAGTSFKNGFVRILQGWKSEGTAFPTKPSPATPSPCEVRRTNTLEEKTTNGNGGHSLISGGERRHSKEDGSDSSKDSSLQSDTSVDSEDSFASVIFVPKPDLTSETSPPMNTSPPLVALTSPTFHSLPQSPQPTSPKLKGSLPPSPKFKYQPPTSPIIKQPSLPSKYQSPTSPGLKTQIPTSPIGLTKQHSLPTSPKFKYSLPPLSPSFSKPSDSQLNFQHKLNFLSSQQKTPSIVLPSRQSSQEAEGNTEKPKTVIPATDIPVVEIRTVEGTVEQLSEVPEIKEETAVCEPPKDLQEDTGRKESQVQTGDASKPKTSAYSRQQCFPIVRRSPAVAGVSNKQENLAKPLPKLLSLELFNPETDDMDSDSSGVSSPDSVSSVISVLTEELSVESHDAQQAKRSPSDGQSNSNSANDSDLNLSDQSLSSLPNSKSPEFLCSKSPENTLKSADKTKSSDTSSSSRASEVKKLDTSKGSSKSLKSPENLSSSSDSLSKSPDFQKESEDSKSDEMTKIDHLSEIDDDDGFREDGKTSSSKGSSSRSPDLLSIKLAITKKLKDNHRREKIVRKRDEKFVAPACEMDDERSSPTKRNINSRSMSPSKSLIEAAADVATSLEGAVDAVIQSSPRAKRRQLELMELKGAKWVMEDCSPDVHKTVSHRISPEKEDHLSKIFKKCELKQSLKVRHETGRKISPEYSFSHDEPYPDFKFCKMKCHEEHSKRLSLDRYRSERYTSIEKIPLLSSQDTDSMQGDCECELVFRTPSKERSRRELEMIVNMPRSMETGSSWSLGRSERFYHSLKEAEKEEKRKNSSAWSLNRYKSICQSRGKLDADMAELRMKSDSLKMSEKPTVRIIREDLCGKGSRRSSRSRSLSFRSSHGLEDIENKLVGSWGEEYRQNLASFAGRLGEKLAEEIDHYREEASSKHIYSSLPSGLELMEDSYITRLSAQLVDLNRLSTELKERNNYLASLSDEDINKELSKSKLETNPFLSWSLANTTNNNPFLSKSNPFLTDDSESERSKSDDSDPGINKNVVCLDDSFIPLEIDSPPKNAFESNNEAMMGEKPSECEKRLVEAMEDLPLNCGSDSQSVKSCGSLKTSKDRRKNLFFVKSASLDDSYKFLGTKASYEKIRKSRDEHSSGKKRESARGEAQAVKGSNAGKNNAQTSSLDISRSPGKTQSTDSAELDPISGSRKSCRIPSWESSMDTDPGPGIQRDLSKITIASSLGYSMESSDPEASGGTGSGSDCSRRDRSRVTASTTSLGHSIESSDPGDVSERTGSGSDFSRKETSSPGTGRTADSITSLGPESGSDCGKDTGFSYEARTVFRRDGRSSSEETPRRIQLVRQKSTVHEPPETLHKTESFDTSFNGSTSQESLPSDNGGGAITFHRYYHVFREGELDQLIEKYVDNLHIISSYYDHANWCVIAEKVQVWTI